MALRIGSCPPKRPSWVSGLVLAFEVLQAVGNVLEVDARLAGGAQHAEVGLAVFGADRHKVAVVGSLTNVMWSGGSSPFVFQQELGQPLSQDVLCLSRLRSCSAGSSVTGCTHTGRIRAVWGW